ncbi:Protein O-mannosyltransferase 2 [Coemansia erecta]|uniref:Protein O-mannosyltransferase 2 n=1 Tax=Coemansia erecta TaxID=147472 RepID=A0A9W8CQ30_9FUNG|nr:Protein O-mannosyltransferase 2 [Coemansia erecta]
MRLSFTSSLLSLLTCIALLLRIHRIGSDTRVVWDETHFGRFATHYITHMFYLDVHPPLGKLVLAFGFWAFGYQGDFGFESGADYPANVPFIAMSDVLCCI